MNILFIEDEEALLAAGMEQIEFLGHVVYPAADLSQAQAILDAPSITLHCIIADRNLPDGCGIKFLVEVSATHPRCKSAIVSAHLTDANIEELKRNNIAYYLKPLLYSTVLSDLLSKYAQSLKPVNKSLSDEYAEYQKKRQARAKERIEKLHKGIELSYRRYLQTRRTYAIAISTLFGLLASGIAASFITNLTYIGVCFIVSFLVAAFKAFQFFLPSSKQREESIELIHSAVNDPTRILSFQSESVRIVGPSGEVVQLKEIEVKIWQTVVVPFFLESKLGAESGFSVNARDVKSRKLNELNRRRKEILDKEEALEIERDRLRAKLEKLQTSVSESTQSPDVIEKEEVLKQREAELQKRIEELERDAKEIEARSDYVTHVENSLVKRLDHLSEREAFIEQREFEAGIRRDP